MPIENRSYSEIKTENDVLHDQVEGLTMQKRALSAKIVQLQSDNRELATRNFEQIEKIRELTEENTALLSGWTPEGKGT